MIKTNKNIHNIRVGFAGVLARLERKIAPDQKVGYRKISYSRSGEDLVLSEIFHNIGVKNGFYVDVGANHPYRCSNTALFDEAGWNGICIEPNDEMASLIKIYRKKCKVLHLAVASTTFDKKLHFFDGHSALGTTSLQAALEAQRIFQINSPLRTENVITKTLTDILNEENIQQIDLLDVDVEGDDLDVLESLDFQIYHPRVILIERTANCNNINMFLHGKGYNEVARLSMNAIFLSNNV
jgi:FkbM family methyltransferase